MVGDVAYSVYPALYIVIFYGNADFFLVDVDFEVGVARTDDGDAEGECFYESGQSYGLGEVQTADDDATFAGYQFSQFVGNHSVGIVNMNGVGH